MKHFACPDFWYCYRQLPPEIQQLADEKYALLRQNSQHPSLRFKKVGRLWSVRIGLKHRALAVEIENGLLWFWIGPHDEYDRILKRG